MPTQTATFSDRSVRGSKLRRDQFTERFSAEHGDLMANRKMMMIASEALVDNVRRRSDRRPQPGETRLRTIEGPGTTREFVESFGEKEADVRIFFEHDGKVGDTFLVGLARITESGCHISPYGVGKVPSVDDSFVFDDGHEQRRFLAENVESATRLWEEAVPERKRSADTVARHEFVSREAFDPSGPFLVEYVDGSKTVKTISQVVESLATQRGPYKVYDKDHVVVMEAAAEVPKQSISISKASISDARDRGRSVVHVEYAAPAGTVDYVGTCQGTLAEGSEVILKSPDGKSLVGKVVESSTAFAMVEAVLAEDAHVDRIRKASEVNLAFESTVVAKAHEPVLRGVVNHRVSVSESSTRFGGQQGTVVEPSLNEDGSPKAINLCASRKFNPLAECFVRLDTGELIAVSNSTLAKI